MYGFVSMVIFGGVYFAMPRILDTRWPHPALISLHFWLVVTGFAVYMIMLSIGSTGGILPERSPALRADSLRRWHYGERLQAHRHFGH
jgi:cbb3-type cytochrome oxidase subunit 1